MSERTEGWGSALNCGQNAHYFRKGRSLCGKYMVLGRPLWESNQSRGSEPKRGSGTCKGCWKKAPEVAP